MKDCKISELFDISETIAASIFEGHTYPWEVLPDIKEFIIRLGNSLNPDKFEKKAENIWIAKSARVFDSAYIGPYTIVDEDAVIRHCAFIRECAIIGKGATVGNSTELKNVILFNKVEAPHYNYVGDSILGFHAHMGAGSITSNIKADRTNVVVKGDEKIETGLRKMGAILGDYAEIGCNAVLNPGSVVCAHSNVYPTSCVRGVVFSGHIFKNDGSMVKKR